VGLRSLRGNAESLVKLLTKFFDSHSNDMVELRDHLASGRVNDARRVAHSLKGAAASLGVVELQRRAAALETAIREQAPDDSILVLASDVAAEFSRVAAAMRARLHEGTSGPRVEPRMTLSHDAMRAALAQLEALLASDDIGAQEAFRDLESILSQLMPGDLERMRDAIESYDYARALDTLHDAMPDVGGT